MTPAPKKAKAAPTTPGDAEVTTVYVGGLSWNVDNDWLKSEFEGLGTVVSARVVTDRDTGKSKGYVCCTALTYWANLRPSPQIRLRRI